MAIETTEGAKRILQSAFVCDMVVPIHEEVGNGYHLLPRFEAAGYTFISLTIAGDDTNASEALHRMASVRDFLRRHADQYLFVETVADVHEAKKLGRLAVGLHFEGTRCFDLNPALISVFYDLGIRQCQLAFNVPNAVGGGCADPADGGLTQLGHKFVAEMNRIGMIVDLSHVGERTTFDAMEASSAPCVISHSNASAVYRHYRNVTDEQIRRCASKGGLIGVSGSSGYLGVERATVASLMRHILHIADLVGPEHVALGMDYVDSPARLTAYANASPSTWRPNEDGSGFSDLSFIGPEELPRIAEALIDAKFSESEASGILGNNYLRLCEEVWRPAGVPRPTRTEQISTLPSAVGV